MAACSLSIAQEDGEPMDDKCLYIMKGLLFIAANMYFG